MLCSRGCRELGVGPGVQLVKTRETLFVMTPHPTYRGLTSDYFAAVGRTIAAAAGWRLVPGEASGRMTEIADVRRRTSP
jgi:hypothetical protein